MIPNCIDLEILLEKNNFFINNLIKEMSIRKGSGHPR